MSDENSADEHCDQNTSGTKSHCPYCPAAVRSKVLFRDVLALDVVRIRNGALGTNDALRRIVGMPYLWTGRLMVSLINDDREGFH